MKSLGAYCTNLSVFVVFRSRQHNVENSMRSAALSVHVSGSDSPGFIAFNHQGLNILQNKEHDSFSEKLIILSIDMWF